MSDTPETDEQINGKPCTSFYVCAGDSLRDAQVPSEFARKLERERNEAREAARTLYWAGHELRRFARAYANDYDEPDGKPGAIQADYAFCEASINLAKVLGEDEEAAK